jgi:hypothetical protein
LCIANESGPAQNLLKARLRAQLVEPVGHLKLNNSGGPFCKRAFEHLERALFIAKTCIHQR